MSYQVTVERARDGEASQTIAQCNNWDLSGPPVWDAPTEPIPADLAELAWEQLGSLTENKEKGSIPVVIGDATYHLAYRRERDLPVTR